jgi:hypothetical protein
MAGRNPVRIGGRARGTTVLSFIGAGLRPFESVGGGRRTDGTGSRK